MVDPCDVLSVIFSAEEQVGAYPIWRDEMRRLARLALLAGCVLPCATERRPNILLAVVDDLGYADIGYNAEGKATALLARRPTSTRWLLRE